MPRSTLSTRVRSARKQLDLSARALDEKAGLTPGHTWLIESGQRSDISGETAKALSRALGVSLDWLLTGEHTPAPQNNTGTDG